MAGGREIHLRERNLASRSQVIAREKIAGVILSGGASRRMGTPKALLAFEGETFLDRLIRVLGRVCDPIVVVVGQHAERIQAGIERAGEVRFAVNPDPERGMLSSLQCGLALAPADAAAAMFLPVDHPNIQAQTVECLAERFRRDRAPVTVPMYRGEHGHPVCIARAIMDDLLALPVEAKASDVIHRHVPDTLYVEVADSAVVTDIDDPAAYAGLLARQV
jgi:molybdenum cofactor cytidylyltransferase